MKLALIAAGILGMVGLALAQRPGPGAPGGFRPPTSRPSGGYGRPDGPGPGRPEFNQAEWDEAREFFARYSPRRYEAFRKINSESPMRRSATIGMILARYRSVKWLQNEDKDLYANKLAQMGAEDGIFGAWMDLRREGLPQDKRQELQQTLRQKVNELVRARLEERRARIERIAQLLQRERESLQRDESRQDELTDEMVKKSLKGDFDWFRDAPPRHHRAGPATQPRRMGGGDRSDAPDRLDNSDPPGRPEPRERPNRPEPRDRAGRAEH